MQSALTSNFALIFWQPTVAVKKSITAKPIIIICISKQNKPCLTTKIDKFKTHKRQQHSVDSLSPDRRVPFLLLYAPHFKNESEKTQV